jgi:hypothetical protein
MFVVVEYSTELGKGKENDTTDPKPNIHHCRGYNDRHWKLLKNGVWEAGVRESNGRG